MTAKLKAPFPAFGDRVKTTGRRRANVGIPKHEQPVKEVAMSAGKRSSAQSEKQVEYRQLSDFPGYRVGNDGSIWSCREAIRGTRLSDKWHQLKPQSRRGYLRVGLWKDGKLHWRSVHRLVLEAFAGRCPDGMECLHAPDPCKANNALSNLRWGTPLENSGDQLIAGTRQQGSGKPDAKLTESDIHTIRKLVSDGLSRRRVAKQYGVSHTVINDIIRGRLWRHV